MIKDKEINAANSLAELDAKNIKYDSPSNGKISKVVIPFSDHEWVHTIRCDGIYDNYDSDVRDILAIALKDGGWVCVNVLNYLAERLNEYSDDTTGPYAIIRTLWESVRPFAKPVLPALVDMENPQDIINFIYTRCAQLSWERVFDRKNEELCRKSMRLAALAALWASNGILRKKLGDIKEGPYEGYAATMNGEIIAMYGGLAFAELPEDIERWSELWDDETRNKMEIKRVRISFENGIEQL
jgi:hypothetical protein